jgi:lysozyme
MTNIQNITDILITQCEGVRLTAYQDERGIFTIGVGLARTYPDGTKINKGDTCTESQAYTWLNEHLVKNVYPYVSKFCNSWNVPDEVYESLCCFVYNEGQMPLIEDSFREAVQTHNWATLANIMRLYNKVRINGVLTYSKGLANRREIEVNNFKKLFEKE